MQTIYAMSDIHGMLQPFEERLKQLDMEDLRSGRSKLILLGDYIDRGIHSLEVLQTIYALHEDLGENLIVLMGNHDKWFLDFLNGDFPAWLGPKESNMFLSRFLSDEELKRVNHLIAKCKQYMAHDIVRKAMQSKHGDMLSWMNALPLYYETDHQIFVHAGIDEEAEDMWPWGTGDEVFLGKYPPTKGYFYKDIIAGHVSTSTASGNRKNHDIYYDGESHFFIDGIDSYPANVKEEDCFIPLLMYTEKNSTGSYYSIDPSGKRSLICEKKW